jgi:hypothetical protein
MLLFDRKLWENPPGPRDDDASGPVKVDPVASHVASLLYNTDLLKMGNSSSRLLSIAAVSGNTVNSLLFFKSTPTHIAHGGDHGSAAFSRGDSLTLLLCPQVLGAASAFMPAAPAVRSWVRVQEQGAFARGCDSDRDKARA